MIQEYRNSFNSNFSDEKYQNFLAELGEGYPKTTFRIAETPLFIPEYLKEKLIIAGDEIINFIKQPNFKVLTESAIPRNWKVPNENDHPHFLAFDFGLCANEDGTISPMLIEMQGFPSLFGFQAHLANCYQKAYQLDANLTPLFNELTSDNYFSLLKKVIIGDCEPKEVVLLDINAHQQATLIDFIITAEHIGCKVLSLEEITKSGDSLFYQDGEEKIKIKRIYNRFIFDEIGNNTELFNSSFDPREKLDIEWITHPNWFYRISKFTMPFLEGTFVPKTQFLKDVLNMPEDLENYVLKPLFSFAGKGVLIDVKASDIAAIKDPENWILQRKVTYAPVLKAPNGGVKAEIRLMYIWPDNEEPQLCINLTRFSRGEMIGVRHNANFDWVGGTVSLML